VNGGKWAVGGGRWTVDSQCAYCSLSTVNCLLADIIFNEFDGLVDAVFGSNFFA
jgi:hypothetical protein